MCGFYLDGCPVRLPSRLPRVKKNNIELFIGSIKDMMQGGSGETRTRKMAKINTYFII